MLFYTFYLCWVFDSHDNLVLVSGGLVAKSCLTLATPWVVAHQAPLSIEFSRQEYWRGFLPVGAISFSRGSFRLRDQIWVSCATCRFFTDWAPREAYIACITGPISYVSKYRYKQLSISETPIVRWGRLLVELDSLAPGSVFWTLLLCWLLQSLECGQNQYITVAWMNVLYW